MARPIGAGDAGPIDAEHHRETVHSDVVDDLVPRPVEERRVDRDDGTQPTHRHAGGSGHRMLLGDPDVEEAIREARLERQQAGWARHRRRDGDEARIGLALLHDGIGEGLRVARRHGLRRSGHRVEHRGVVQVLLVVVLCGWVAAALLGENVDDDRPVRRQLDGVAERLLELGDVVPVDGSDVANAERLEERRRLEELADRRLERLDGALGRRSDDRHVAQEVLQLALAADVDGVESDVRQHLRQPIADARRQRLVLVLRRRLAFGRRW